MFGGTADDDNSGTLRWVRVRYAGNQITDTNQYNGIAFQGVGSGTTVDYVETLAAQDDGIEFFGGTVNAKHLLIRDSGDDSLDWTFGWRGKAQFVVIHQNAGNDRGIEADNNSRNFTATPLSNPTISNVTIIGAVGTNDAMTFRNGTAGQFWNACVTTPEANCIDLDTAETFANAGDGSLTLRNFTLSCE